MKLSLHFLHLDTSLTYICSSAPTLLLFDLFYKFNFKRILYLASVYSRGRAMAESSGGGTAGIPQIIKQKKPGWLHQNEICQYIQDHNSYVTTQPPPLKPPSGSIILYNRNVVKGFRNDGHEWEKKKESHATLKEDGANVLHCYYAKGEKNENFQRRIYWKIESDLKHIALVHYLEVQGHRSNDDPQLVDVFDSLNPFELSFDTYVSHQPANPFFPQVPESPNIPFSENTWQEGETPRRQLPASFENDPRLPIFDELFFDQPVDDQPFPEIFLARDNHAKDVTANDHAYFKSAPADDMDVDNATNMLPSVYSIFEFAPNWAYQTTKQKVLIYGKFLTSQEAQSCHWSCVFGEAEVPAVFKGEGVLVCTTPEHKAGRVSFYVKNSTKSVCSKEEEFEFRIDQSQDVDAKSDHSRYRNEIYKKSLEELLCPSPTPPTSDSLYAERNSNLTYDKTELPVDKLPKWLVQKVNAGGKGLCVTDKNGMSALHYAAILGYDWILKPTITSGISVNSAAVNGWTAIHWAAYYGRKDTVGMLLLLGADAGLLTGKGDTAAQLASSEGHQELSYFLSERAKIFQPSSHSLDIRRALVLSRSMSIKQYQMFRRAIKRFRPKARWWSWKAKAS
ncbi:hypothetical protein ABKV19_022572 [Rosa sericea]